MTTHSQILFQSQNPKCVCICEQFHLPQHARIVKRVNLFGSFRLNPVCNFRMFSCLLGVPRSALASECCCNNKCSADKKKSSKASRKANGATETSSKVALDMETLGMLSKLKLPVPTTVSDVPGLVEKICAKRTEYEDKQRRALAGEKVVEEEEEQAASTSKQEDPTPDSSSVGSVAVSMRCDEAFGQVILAIAVN
jgi:hypothetical protein